MKKLPKPRLPDVLRNPDTAVLLGILAIAGIANVIGQVIGPEPDAAVAVALGWVLALWGTAAGYRAGKKVTPRTGVTMIVGRTSSGMDLTEADIERLAEEAEAGYDLSRLRPRGSRSVVVAASGDSVPGGAEQLKDHPDHDQGDSQREQQMHGDQQAQHKQNDT